MFLMAYIRKVIESMYRHIRQAQDVNLPSHFLNSNMTISFNIDYSQPKHTML